MYKLLIFEHRFFYISFAKLPTLKYLMCTTLINALQALPSKIWLQDPKMEHAPLRE